MNAKITFKINDVVWAKLKGFPWWPAVVVKFVHNKEHVNDNVVLIKFIGDLTTAVISISRLLSFDEHYIRFSTTKHKQLLRAIAEAKRIHNGEISFNHYCKSVKHLGNKRTRNTNENVDNEINKLNNSLTNIISTSQFNVNDVIHLVRDITQLLHNVKEERNKRKIRRVKHKVIALLNMHLFAYDNSDILHSNDNTLIDVCELKNEICNLIEMYNKHNNATAQQSHAFVSIKSYISVFNAHTSFNVLSLLVCKISLLSYPNKRILTNAITLCLIRLILRLFLSSFTLRNNCVISCAICVISLTSKCEAFITSVNDVLSLCTSLSTFSFVFRVRLFPICLTLLLLLLFLQY